MRLVFFYEKPCAYAVAQSCPILCDPTNCSLPGSSVHGIVQATSGLPFSLPGDPPNPRIKPASNALVGGFFTTELQEKSIGRVVSY